MAVLRSPLLPSGPRLDAAKLTQLCGLLWAREHLDMIGPIIPPELFLAHGGAYSTLWDGGYRRCRRTEPSLPAGRLVKSYNRGKGLVSVKTAADIES